MTHQQQPFVSSLPLCSFMSVETPWLSCHLHGLRFWSLTFSQRWHCLVLKGEALIREGSLHCMPCLPSSHQADSLQVGPWHFCESHL